MDSHLCMIGGRVSSVLAELPPLLGLMPMKVRKEVVYSKAASLVLYGAELYTGMTNWTLT